MQDIILLRGQELSYAKESIHLRKRILQKDEHLLLKDVSFTLYRGEMLGVLSDYETLYYLKDMITGTIEPKTGKVKSEAVIASLDVMDHVQNKHQVQMFLSELFDEYMSPQKMDESLNELKGNPFFKRLWYRDVNTLTRTEMASVLMEASTYIEADIFIFCNMSNHLSDGNRVRFKEIVSAFEKDDKGVMLLETDVDMIKGLSNYFLWLSYGQVRYEGGVQKGIAHYNKYLKDKSQIKNVDEEALFDLKWKRNISEYAHYKHNMQRLSKKQTSLIDQLSIRRIIVSLVLLFIIMASSAVIFMNINLSGTSTAVETETVPMEEEAGIESFVYGLVLDETLEIDGETLPYLSLVDIVEIHDDSYTVIVNEAEHEVDESHLLYFNPASLYTETSFDELLQYADDTFRESDQFYSRMLNRESEDVIESFNLQADDYHGEVPGVPVTYHFRNDRAISITFPATDIDGLLDDYGLTGEQQVFRVEDGYMILDGENENWVYINR
ncbi:hypothetical protein [Salinicoccus sp. YB14-2]|uniref:hypothetical protein n=1 Tax=Salinicoccus sp. YB14-2 TaxID=1572701 RepID=UPI00068F6F69|nr:hypothetical protein [Salinicoccus sp. YB14-2]